MEIKILVTGVEGYVGGMVYQQLEILTKYFLSFKENMKYSNRFINYLALIHFQQS